MATPSDMEKPGILGHLEVQILTALMMQGGEDYGVPIYEKLCKITERHVNQGGFYLTLDRLAEKNLISVRDDTAKGRGKKRFYRLEPAGWRALEQSIAGAKRLAALFDENSERIETWLSTGQSQEKLDPHES